ncbi:Sedlin [Delphinella strobiligena]|nr:Sedlin [Delphinella strobiligena]
MATSTRSPAIACIGVIGRQNNPLHISLFPAEDEEEPRSRLEFSFMLSTCLDIFEARLPTKTVQQDFGLLQAVDERLAMYGYLTNTGVKFVVVVDMEGRASSLQDNKNPAVLGLKNSDITPAFQALQQAYIHLLRNPFYTPDEHTPAYAAKSNNAGSTQITSRRFIQEVDRIGRSWTPTI